MNPTCVSCMDKGCVTSDGQQVSCHCPAGTEWATNRYAGRRGDWPRPDLLPPGGDVLLREAARAEAGLPVGALAGAPVRAMLVNDGLLEAALAHVVALSNELRADNETRRAAERFLDELPDGYRATLPHVRKGRRAESPRRSAVPMAPPSR